MKDPVKNSWMMVFLGAQLAVAFGAFAGETSISEHHCAPASIQNVHTLFTRYNDYSRMPGAAYTVNLAGVDVELIRMVKSQAKLVSSTGQDSRNNVWMVLQPALVEEGTLYPRFLLDCSVKWTGANRFDQLCALQKDKQHFGLDDLRMSVRVIQGEKGCGANQSGIQIDVKMVSNPVHVERIKAGALGAAGVLAPLLSVLFDEDSFFREYFHYIYGEWIKTL